MSLPLSNHFKPMEAQPATDLPSGPEWQYEPKWDGFRCLAFRDGKRIELVSKSGKPLTRSFPELVSALSAVTASQFVLDAEIVIPVDGALSFDDLLLRIHPAASRVHQLSQSTPAIFIGFDLLVDDTGALLADLPLEERREKLERFANRYLKANRAIRVSPVTDDVAVARIWFHLGVALDG